MSTVYAHCVFSYNWVAFLKSSSSTFDFEQWKKEVREEEKSSSTVGLFVILDNVPARLAGHLKSGVN